MKVEAFDIKRAQAGETVITAAGKVITRFVWNIKNADREDDFLAIVKGESGAENVWRYRSNGTFLSSSNGAKDKDLYILVGDEPSDFEKKLKEIIDSFNNGRAKPVTLEGVAFYANQLLEIALGKQREEELSEAHLMGLREGREQVRATLPHWRKRKATGFGSQRFTIQPGDILSDQISGLEIPIEELLRSLPLSEQEDYPLTWK